MNALLRRLLAAIVLSSLLLLGLASPAAADDEGGGGDNVAVAINTKDGQTVFRLAFAVRRITNGVVDQGNAAVAYASCAECTTVALAFQVLLVTGDADVVAPENLALALNDQCSSCVTYAAATQLVLGFDGPVRLTADGQRRLSEVRRSLRQLRKDAETLTVAELEQAVANARAELHRIFREEVVAAGRDDDSDDDEEAATTTTTTEAGADASTTTTTSSSTTTSTSTTSPTTTSSTTNPTP